MLSDRIDHATSRQRDAAMQSVGFIAMGTQCSIHFCGSNNEILPVVRAAIAEVERIEEKYSRYLPTSFLSDINRCGAAGSSIDLDEETSALLDYAARSHLASDGLFDITSGAFRRIWDVK